jgi:hypothetical protein
VFPFWWWLNVKIFWRGSASTVNYWHLLVLRFDSSPPKELPEVSCGFPQFLQTNTELHLLQLPQLIQNNSSHFTLYNLNKRTDNVRTFRTHCNCVQDLFMSMGWDGPIVHPPFDTRVDSRGGMILTGENRRPRRKVVSQYHFVHHKAHVDWPGREPRPPRWEAGN